MSFVYIDLNTDTIHQKSLGFVTEKDDKGKEHKFFYFFKALKPILYSMLG